MDSPKAHTTPILCFQTVKCLIDTLYKYFDHWVCLCWAITLFVRKKIFFWNLIFCPKLKNWPKLTQKWDFWRFCEWPSKRSKIVNFCSKYFKKVFWNKKQYYFRKQAGDFVFVYFRLLFQQSLSVSWSTSQKKGKKIRIPLFVVRYSIALPLYYVFRQYSV